jgi:hypothetical protein
MVKSTNGKTNWTQDRRPVDSPRCCGHHRPLSCLVDAPHVRSLEKRADMGRGQSLFIDCFGTILFLSRRHINETENGPPGVTMVWIGVSMPDTPSIWKALTSFDALSET